MMEETWEAGAETPSRFFPGVDLVICKTRNPNPSSPISFAGHFFGPEFLERKIMIFGFLLESRPGFRFKGAFLHDWRIFPVFNEKNEFKISSNPRGVDKTVFLWWS